VFCGVGDVCKTAVTREENDEEEEVDPRRRVDACEYYFEEAECRIESVLGDVGPHVEAAGEGGEEDGPVDYGDEEVEGGYGAVEEVVESLQGTWEAV